MKFRKTAQSMTEYPHVAPSRFVSCVAPTFIEIAHPITHERLHFDGDFSTMTDTQIDLVIETVRQALLK